MRVRIDGETCTGHGRCAKYAPSVYVLDEVDGYNIHRGTIIDVPAGEEHSATLGSRACPERAITIVDNSPATGERHVVVEEVNGDLK